MSSIADLYVVTHLKLHKISSAETAVVIDQDKTWKTEVDLKKQKQLTIQAI